MERKGAKPQGSGKGDGMMVKRREVVWIVRLILNMEGEGGGLYHRNVCTKNESVHGLRFL